MTCYFLSVRRLFLSLMLLFALSGFRFGSNSLMSYGNLYNPSLIEGDSNYYSMIAIPGFSKSEVKLSVKHGSLILSGKSKNKGTFKYHISLPTDAKADKVKAEFFDGVLRITIPTGKDNSSREVKIK